MCYIFRLCKAEICYGRLLARPVQRSIVFEYNFRFLSGILLHYPSCVCQNSQRRRKIIVIRAKIAWLVVLDIYLTIHLAETKSRFVRACYFSAKTEAANDISCPIHTANYQTPPTENGYLLSSGTKKGLSSSCLLKVSVLIGRDVLRPLF